MSKKTTPKKSGLKKPETTQEQKNKYAEALSAEKKQVNPAAPKLITRREVIERSSNKAIFMETAPDTFVKIDRGYWLKHDDTPGIIYELVADDIKRGMLFVRVLKK